MPKLKAVVEYDGSNYHGWQLQPNATTVQGEIEIALSRIFRERIVVFGAGRTDAGVHAIGQVIHIEVPWKHSTDNLKKALNSLLPDDICILGVSTAQDDFHARHSAISKTYRYQILNQQTRSPLKRLYFWEIAYPLDLGKLQEASKLLVGINDFSSFGAPTSGTPSTVRKIYEAFWEKDDVGNTFSFTITGSGFLRFMVRSLVGTLVRVGLGKITVGDFADIFRACDRSKAGPIARPQGLFLVTVEYSEY